MTTSPQKIIILGAGISGITTGIVLQALGYRTHILARDRADRTADPRNPAFASLYPAASVIPHSVEGTAAAALLASSANIFGVLNRIGFPGVGRRKHYEVFEYEVADPAYTGVSDGFQRIDRSWREDPDVPRLASTGELHGWAFRCYFADWSHYLPRLFALYEELGGCIDLHEVGPDELDTLESTVVNCTGLGSSDLFEDEDNRSVLKGTLVRVIGTPDLTGHGGELLSYNYNPSPERYCDREGRPQDLYCYPRSDDWILGGSRLKGTAARDGQWSGTGTGATTRELTGIEVPTPILEMNEEIISVSYGFELSDYPGREAVSGYRYTRAPDGLRLERRGRPERPLIHNYGHGGAGVTLSWGCAVRIARWIAEVMSPGPLPQEDHPLVQALSGHLHGKE